MFSAPINFHVIILRSLSKQVLRIIRLHFISIQRFMFLLSELTFQNALTVSRTSNFLLFLHPLLFKLYLHHVIGISTWQHLLLYLQ